MSNFSIHLEEQTARKLKTFVKKAGKTRNAVINEAIRSFLNISTRSDWPVNVRELAGLSPDLEPFENARKKLKATPKDPLA